MFKAGIVLLLAAAVEWMVQGWSERASADPAYNAGLRKRMLHPLEFPVLAAVGLAAIIYSFSRIMLWIDKSGGPVVFIVAGALVLFGGFVFASKPSLKKGVVAGVCAIAALGLVSTGAVMAIDGQREIEEHPTTATDNGAVCELAEEARANRPRSTSWARRPSPRRPASASPSSSRTASCRPTSRQSPGPQNPVTVPRGNVVNVIFKNRDRRSVG